MRALPQMQSYAPYHEPSNYTTPAHDPDNGPNAVYSSNLGYSGFASQYSKQPNNVLFTVLNSWVQPPKSEYEVKAVPGGSLVASEHGKLATAPYAMGSR